ncbi:hypothetical protein BU23DRAFT_603369 [Bimuria novae-zelandiae CBS 107.79]|uniref:Uncharacterized protein n=1 Tax=Bimuria novae-zelandiae CBS 107.79 TaxID=1447943 RepID=A0A6A5UPW5_9PLEO|nr:hypothetical protein BU23DRAFT_603369 [Bimuria novae-zelandiae CBS 107.79]
MSRPLSMTWVQSELIPFLDLSFNIVTGYEPKTHEQWEAEIARAEKRINTIRNYDNSIINIDRIRLVLSSSPNVDAEDQAQALQVINDQELVITMFVRHAVTRGPYPLISLGVGKNPEANRERELLRQKKQKLPSIVTAKPARNGRGAGGPRNNNRSSSVNNQYLPNWNPMPQYLPAAQSSAYTAAANTLGFNPAPYQSSRAEIESCNDAYLQYPQEVYGAGFTTQASSTNVSALSTMFTPHAFANYKESATGEYTNVANGQGQVQSHSPQGRLHVAAPVFVPGKAIHNTLHAPEFVPGVQEHRTLSMAGDQLL